MRPPHTPPSHADAASTVGNTPCGHFARARIEIPVSTLRTAAAQRDAFDRVTQPVHRLQLDLAAPDEQLHVAPQADHVIGIERHHGGRLDGHPRVRVAESTRAPAA